jgi:glucokinase
MKSNSPSRIAIAVDVGGTKIRSALINEDGALLAATRAPTEASLGAARVLKVIEQSIDELLLNQEGPPPIGIGFSSAGVIAPDTGLVVAAADQIPGWAGQSLGQYFEHRYHVPVVADNDANCALVGEVWRGQHPLSANPSVIMLTLGTGLGGAMMVDGRLMAGSNHLTGHFGIARIWDRYRHCEVKTEQLVSGTGLGNIYAHIVAAGRTYDGGEVVQRVHAQETSAITALNRWCDELALLLHNLHWAINCERIIIGGGMIDSRALWWQPVVDRLVNYGVEVPLAAATLGNDAGVYGAAKHVFVKVGQR